MINLYILLSFKKLLDITNKNQSPENKMNQPFALVNAPSRSRARKVFGVQLSKNNARALLSRISSIVNPDWLQHARSVRGVYEYYANIRSYRGLARRGTHLFAHDFAPPLGFLFCIARYGEKQLKTLELLIYITERFKIKFSPSVCANNIVTLI